MHYLAIALVPPDVSAEHIPAFVAEQMLRHRGEDGAEDKHFDYYKIGGLYDGVIADEAVKTAQAGLSWWQRLTRGQALLVERNTCPAAECRDRLLAAKLPTLEPGAEPGFSEEREMAALEAVDAVLTPEGDWHEMPELADGQAAPPDWVSPLLAAHTTGTAVVLDCHA